MLDRYSHLAVGASVIEVQKLMYFLQEAGHELRLRYEAGIYGPYPDNLRHVLISMDGHQLEGYGDGSRAVQDAEPISIIPEALVQSERLLGGPGRAIVERIDRVLSLVAGFESPYGLELLASVHWCATRRSGVDSAAEAATCVRSWTERKSRMFTDRHVEAAWNRLQEHGWLSSIPVSV